MAEEPIDLIRLEGEGNSVVLRVMGKEARTGRTGTESEPATDVLVAEFLVDTPFVRGSLETRLVPEDLRQWQKALDMLDTGLDVAWREHTRSPSLFIEFDKDDDRCRVTIEDHSTSLTAVTVTVPLTDAWFDDAYRRLDMTWETWPLDGA
ncbi:DUF5959 family protein [Streptomyces sp. NPDC002676]